MACRIAATVHGKRCVSDAKLFTYDFKTKARHAVSSISLPYRVGLKCKTFDGRVKPFDIEIGMINAVKGACMYDNPKNLSIAVFGDGRLWIYYSTSLCTMERSPNTVDKID